MKARTGRAALALLLVLGAGCRESRAVFFVIELEVDIENCSFDEGQALRRAYASWSSADVLVLEVDPVERESRVCVLETEEAGDCVSVSGSEASEGTIERTSRDGFSETASYSMMVDYSTELAVDQGDQTMTLSFSLLRTLTCEGDCAAIPDGDCKVTAVWRGSTADDLSFYTPP